jgi:thioredoxin 1
MRNILYFTADWCNPCKRVRPIVDNLNRDSATVKFQIIDVDSEMKLAQNFNVRSVPSFIVIEDGKEITRATGAQTAEELEALMFNQF